VLHLRDENKVFLGNAVKNASANATNLEEMFKNLQFLLKDQNRMKILAFSKN